MHILLGMDCTDNLDSIGTGEVLQNLCHALVEKKLGRCGFITSHQLYLHETIPYTTHNCTLCCNAEIKELSAVLQFCRAYMDNAGTEGAAPGLCIIDLEKLRYKKRLIRFGLAAKKMVLKKQEAIDVANLHKWAVHISEHGGDGKGVIGALAGCGLRLSGFDGKIRGVLDPPEDSQVMTIGELCRSYNVTYAIDKERHQVHASDTVWFCCPTSAVLFNSAPAICLSKEKSGKAAWRVCKIHELKGMVV